MKSRWKSVGKKKEEFPKKTVEFTCTAPEAKEAFLAGEFKRLG